MESSVAAQGEGRAVSRKVQRLGSSSLIITLPREWARNHGLRAGSLVTVVEDGNRLVVVPGTDERAFSASFSLRHLNLCKHLGRALFCAYLSGLDRVSFYSNRPIRQELVDRLSQAAKVVGEEVSVSLTSPYEVEAEIEEYRGDVVSSLANYGRQLASAFSRLAEHVTGLTMGGAELDETYGDLRTQAFRLLRSGSKGFHAGLFQDHLARLLMAGVGLMALANDSYYMLAKDILFLTPALQDDERERLKFLLQVLEVSLVAAAAGIDPVSVKKEEDAYYKLRVLLDIEDQLGDIVRASSPSFAYILAKILDVARVIKNFEETLLCYALFKKYSENGRETQVLSQPRGH
ncbi:MAG: AbrB/MazE/SpoVT family DNA-binding domain-containing protein [Acidilobus sp.]